MAKENDRDRKKNPRQQDIKGNLGQKEAKQQAKSDSELTHMGELSKDEKK